MLRLKFTYGDKSFIVSPYTTQVEKDLLLMDSFENYDLKDALLLLGLSKDEVKDLTVDEQLALMFYFRSISVSEELPVKYRCQHCNHPVETTINISENIVEPKTDLKIKQCFKPLTEDNINDFIDINVDELDIDEFNELFNKVKDAVIKFDFAKKSMCIKCGEINVIDLGNPKKILEYMSEDSLVSLYQVYNDLSFFGRYTKADIDSMFPFERSIFIGLLNKTREELNK